jgi:RNA polymerase primary sigma factor
MNNDKTDQYYFKEIQRYPILNPEEQRDLADRIEMGDEKALKRLIECNLRLVVSEARKIVSRDIPLYDLIQEGNIGLMVAAIIPVFLHTLTIGYVST